MGTTWWAQGTGGMAAEQLKTSGSLCVYFCVSVSSFSFRVHLFLYSSLLCLSVFLSLFLPRSPPPPEPKVSSTTEPGTSKTSKDPSLCTPLISCILCVLFQWHQPGTSCHPTGCHYDSVWVGRDDQPHQLCLWATPTRVLVFGERASCLEEHVVPMLCLCPNRAWPTSPPWLTPSPGLAAVDFLKVGSTRCIAG